MYKENISGAYNVLDREIEEPPSIDERNTKNKADELARLHAAIKEKLVTLQVQKICKYWLWFLILGDESIVLNTLEFQSI